MSHYFEIVIADIRQLLEAQPFEPFSILTSSGKQFRVPTSDHGSINPQGTRVIIFWDDESHVTISPLHIVTIKQGASAV